MFLDGASLPSNAGGLTGLLRNWGAWILRWGIGFTAIFATFAFLKHRAALAAIWAGAPAGGPIWLLTHAVSACSFAALSAALYSGHVAPWPDLTVTAWLFAAILTVLSAALALMPLRVWLTAIRQTGPLWWCAALCSAAACQLGALSQYLWEPATRTTFTLVKFLLSGVVAGQMVVQPGASRIGTPRFTVVISQDCSGLEGAGLLLIFGLVWLVLFRDELRFPRALVLLPAALAGLYFLNAVRIAALVLIGDAGWREIAVRGFHSQAGWISFNLVAFGLSMGARRLKWIAVTPTGTLADSGTEYPAAPYLAPFLAILAAGILSGAMSGGFEWAYPLRLPAACFALWFFRGRYSGIDWHWGWLALVAGAAVFGVWIGLDWLTAAHAPAPMPAAMAAASVFWRTTWIVFRIAGGVIAVPIAEELAFRGFGLRRLIAEEFEGVSWRAFTWTSLLASSLVFGLMHGGMWLAATLAGILYALTMSWRGRLGDAVAAHATTNALLAAYVLWSERWDLW